MQIVWLIMITSPCVLLSTLKDKECRTSGATCYGGQNRFSPFVLLQPPEIAEEQKSGLQHVLWVHGLFFFFNQFKLMVFIFPLTPPHPFLLPFPKLINLKTNMFLAKGSQKINVLEIGLFSFLASKTGSHMCPTHFTGSRL